MTTKVTVSLSTPPAIPMKAFETFQRGETLLPTEHGRPNGAVGIKLDATMIYWLCTSDGCTTGRYCECTVPEKLYGVPAAVDIKVTL